MMGRSDGDVGQSAFAVLFSLLLVTSGAVAGIAFVTDTASAQTGSDSDVLYRVNAGGSTISATDGGPDWEGVSASSTTYFNGDAAGDTPSGSAPSSIDTSVPSSTPSDVFVNEIGDPPGGEEMQWAFDVPEGTQVEVRLYFADEHAQDRSFDVDIENTTVLQEYDPNDDVGHDVGTMQSFTTTSDGTVDIDFFHGSGASDTNPFVNAIEIVQAEPTPDTLGASPSGIDFGQTVVDDSGTESIQLTNLGGDGDPAIIVEGTSITGPDASAFSDGFDDTGSVTLQPGESTTVPVTFAPSSAGVKGATLEVSHSGSNSPTTVDLTGDGSSSVPVGFDSSVATTNLSSGTALDFGPDGRLYVAQESGVIKAFTIERQGENDYQVTDVEEITTVVDDITNHNDDGSVYTGSDADERQITGILVEGTAQNPEIYVSSSDPRFHFGGHQDPSNSIDTNSGVISRLTWTGSNWDHVQLVRGIARSSEAHSPNGLALNETANELYLANGGHTMHGAPGNQFSYLPEYATSAAIVSIDLDQIESMPTETDADGDPVKYDLPTLQPDISEAPNDAPWGGMDGRNQGMLTVDGPVQIHSPGYRNPYDVLISEDGQMYASDNGPDGSGGTPVSVPGGCTNADSSGSFGGPDQIHYIPEEGYYAGHPNPVRASPDVAGLYDPATQANEQVLDFNESFTPVPFSMANPEECQYEHPSSSQFPDDGSIAQFGASTNGMTEYTASNFGGEMQGDLLIASFDNTVHRIQLTADGTDATSNTQIFSGFGSIPLDVTAQGDDEKFPGTVWAVRYSSNPAGPGFGGSDGIIAFEPNDYEQTEPDTCTGADDPNLDEDGDGYDNADEIDVGTDPCSAASQPADYDDDGISNLNDADDDNDGIPDTEDPFAIDADNGLSTTLPVERGFQAASYPGTLLDLGFTGLMSNGTNYANLYEEDNIFKGGASQDLVVNEVAPGDANDENTLANGFQFGVNTPDENFTVHTVVQEPFPQDGGQTPQGGPDGNQQVGVFLGDGTQQNWTKLVVTAHGGDGGVEFSKDVNDQLSVVNMPQDSAVVGDGTQIDLWLHVDPQNDTVTAEYGVDGGQNVTVGTTTVPPGWTDESDGQGMAVGVYSTTNGFATFPATWDTLEVTPDEPGTVNQAPSAAFSAVPSAPDTGEDVVFDASASSDADGSIASYEWDFDGDGQTDETGQQVIHNFSSAGQQSVTLTVTDDDGDFDTASQTLTVSDDTAPSDGQVVYRVNSGGPEVAHGDGGPAWSADTDANPSPYRITDDQTYTVSDPITFDDSVPAGTPEAIFQSERWDGEDNGSQEWKFPVTAGETYEVRLYFAEIAWYGPDGETSDAGDEVGPRVFDAEIEGQQVLDDYEIHEDVGHDVGTVKTFTVTPSDSTLDIDLLHVNDDPKTSAIEIVQVDDSAANQPPQPSIGVSDTTPTVGQTVTFDATGSLDPDGLIQSYAWDFDGDGQTDATGQQVTHPFDAVGDETVTLTVTDDAGESASAVTTLTVVQQSDGGVTMAQIVANQTSPADEISLSEAQQAVNWWATDTPVPGSGGETLTLAETQQIVNIWATDGTVEQPTNQPPTAAFSANETAPTVGQAVAFDASGSADSDGSIASYAWDFDGDGQTDATGAQVTHAYDSAGTASVTLTVTDDAGATDTASQTIDVSEPTAQNASALVEITTDNVNGVDTAISGGGGSYGVQITNTGDVAIESVRMNHTEALLPDLVLDPNRTAGDSAGEGFDVYDGVGGTTTTSFDDFHNGVDGDDGWDAQGLTFTDFGPGEQLGYTVDMDPNSIKGASPPGPATTGGVSGLELSGTVVTIAFENGEMYTTQLFSDGSAAGGQAVVDATTADDPTIGVDNVSLGPAGGSPVYNGATVADAQQTITVGGTPGETVHLLHAEAGRYVEGNGLNGGYDIDPYEANKVIDVQDPYSQAYTATIGQDGTAEIPVTLQNSTAEGGYNYFVATTEDADGDTGLISEVVVLQYDPAATNQSPTASFTANESAPTANETVAFDASASTDPDGSIASYSWNFDDDTEIEAYGQQVTHVFPAAGEYEVTLTVSDDDGATDTATQTITVADAPQESESDVLYRINAGGPTVSALSDGPEWSVDNASSPSPYHNSGSSAYTYDPVTQTTDAVPAYVPLEIFESERGDPPESPTMQWAFPVESGTSVEVRLYFADVFEGTSQPGDRKFNVSVEGSQVLTNYDIIATAGDQTGHMETFTVTSDGTVNLELAQGSGAPDTNPVVQGIEIVNVSDGGQSNAAPTASFTANQTAMTTDQPVAFDASGSSDADGSIASYEWDFDGDGTTDATGQQATHAFDTAGDYEVTLTVTDDAGATDTATQTVSVTDPIQGTVEYRVNAGGSQIAATDGGPAWGADSGGNPSPYMVTGAETYSDSFDISYDSTVPAGTPEALFESERYDGGTLAYEFPVEQSATYQVRLYFAEIGTYGNDYENSSAAPRLFDIALDNQTVVTEYEPYEAAGGSRFAGTMETFEVSPDDGTLDVDFPAVNDNAKLSAIEVIQTDAAPTNEAPTAAFSANETAATVGQAVAFDAGTSSDPDGSIASYEWDFDGDGTTDATGLQVTHAFDTAGEYDVTLTVIDDDGATASSNQTVTVSAPNQPPTIDPIANQTVEAGQSLDVTVTASDDSDAPTLSASNLPEFATFTDVGDGTGTLSLAPQAGDNGTYELTVTATDGEGLTDSERVNVTVTEPPQTGPEVLYRLNAGGANVSATDDGPTWIGVAPGDTTYYNGVADSPDRGAASSVDATVPDSTPDQVFATELGDPPSGPEMQWELDVPAGETVELRLYYADTFAGSAGVRAFDVALDGTTVENDYDIVANSGDNVGHMENYTLTSDGTIDLDFFHGPDSAADPNPQVNAIEVVSVPADSQNEAPYAATAANQTSATVGETVAFDAAGSNDLDGSIQSYAWDFDGDGTTDATGQQVTHAFASAGEYDVALTVTDEDGATDTATVTVSVTDPAEQLKPGPQVGTVAYRINAGGSQVAAGDAGPAWSADTGQYVVAGGETYSVSNAITLDGTVPSGTSTALFQSERYPSDGGPHEWEFPVDVNATYEVRLYFAEIGGYSPDYESDPNAPRVFNVSVEEEVVLESYEPYEAAGGTQFKGTVEAVTVSPDGTLDIDFESLNDNSKISAIEIVEIDASGGDN